MTDPQGGTVIKLLLGLALVFFVWAAVSSTGLVPHEGWLVPGGLAAWVLSLLIPLLR